VLSIVARFHRETFSGDQNSVHVAPPIHDESPQAVGGEHAAHLYEGDLANHPLLLGRGVYPNLAQHPLGHANIWPALKPLALEGQ
jgi:hypothetical protein